MSDQRTDRVIARLSASAPRRVLGAGILLALGLVLVWIGVAHPPASVPLHGFVLLIGAAALWLAVRLWQATAVALELTEHELREAGGRRLAALRDIASVSRGAFAFKPSNGFLIELRDPAPRAWAPGLWWRVGRRVGVGGVTGRHEGRFMAELIDQRLSDLRAAAREDQL
ncbi:MAG: hypothetical protein ACK4KW_08190 [Gemmobacter sp.]